MLTDPVSSHLDEPIPLSSLHREMILRIITTRDESKLIDENKKSVCWKYLTSIITETQEGVVFRKLLKTVKKYKKK